jgi:acylphosphatase
MLRKLQPRCYKPLTIRKVQGEAQGSDDAIKEFIQHLKKGPLASDVSGVEHSEISTKFGEDSFDVK